MFPERGEIYLIINKNKTFLKLRGNMTELVHEIHTTEMRSFRACRRRWDWSFRENLQPNKTAVPLEFGIAFHKAMEKMYDPKTWGAPRTLIAQFAEAAFFDECSRQKKAYYDQIGNYLDEDKERDYDSLVRLGRGMIYWYVQNHLPVADWTVVAVEQKFQVPVLDPYTGKQVYCKCQICRLKWIHARAEGLAPNAIVITAKEFEEWPGLPVVYEGRVDAIVRDRFGDHWVLDWKTTSRMMNEDSDVVLELDDQVTGYVWALRQKLGLAIRGFKYVELRKGFPEPPTKLKVVRLGRSFSVSQNQITDVETFIQTVSREDKGAYEAGLYAEYINWLKTEGTKFIHVHTVYKSEQQLSMFTYESWEQVMEMTDPELRMYKSPGRFSCGFCAYREPCIDKDQGADYQYGLKTLYQIKPRYYALAAASTDRGMNN